MKNRLRELRKMREMSQARLSEVSGVHRVSIARYELGIMTPTVENLAKLAKALDVTMDDLLIKKAG